jgi:hypothetical protein
MRTAAIFLLAAFFFGSAAQAAQEKEYAIIKDTMFGTQKIEIYQSLKEALENYTGEGKLYEITRKDVPVKRVESTKKVEVTEYKWVAEDTGKTEPVIKTEKTDKPAAKTDRADKPATKTDKTDKSAAKTEKSDKPATKTGKADKPATKTEKTDKPVAPVKK